VRDFRVTWSKMCEAAKVDILLHDLRRTAVRKMVRSGISKLTAKRGDKADLEDAAEKLQARELGTN
jgi:hypothetical protein